MDNEHGMLYVQCKSMMNNKETILERDDSVLHGKLVAITTCSIKKSLKIITFTNTNFLAMAQLVTGFH